MWTVFLFGAVCVSSTNEGGAPYDESLDEVRALVRPNIRQLKPYRCARDDYEKGVLLDANENAHGPALAPDALYSDDDRAFVAAALRKDLHRYPDPHQRELKDRVAEFRGVARDNVFVGVGSDEAIDLLFRVFCEPRRANIVVTPATYGMYKVYAAVQDVEVRDVPLIPETFTVDISTVERVADANTRLVFLCSPGNPTARSIPRADVEALLASPALRRAIIVVDEAYVDFSSEASLAPLVFDHPRLVVLHTFSKGFGLAGIRIGTAIGATSLVQYMNNVKAPYSINKLSSAVACAALEPEALETFKRNIAATLEQRARVAAALEKKFFVCTVFHSDSNFLLVRIKNRMLAKTLWKRLADRGVVVRYRGDEQNLAGCIRITIGTAADNDVFLALLDKVTAELGLDYSGARL